MCVDALFEHAGCVGCALCQAGEVDRKADAGLYAKLQETSDAAKAILAELAVPPSISVKAGATSPSLSVYRDVKDKGGGL